MWNCTGQRRNSWRRHPLFRSQQEIDHVLFRKEIEAGAGSPGMESVSNSYEISDRQLSRQRSQLTVEIRELFVGLFVGRPGC